MYSHRSVCLHLPSDDIHLYVYAPLRQGLATVCFYWKDSIYLRSVCLHLHVPQMTKCRHVFLPQKKHAHKDKPDSLKTCEDITKRCCPYKICDFSLKPTQRHPAHTTPLKQ